MNYEELDLQAILNYIARRGGECSVNDIIRYSGANKLRIYPILCKLELNGKIEVTAHEMFGAPQRVRIKL